MKTDDEVVKKDFENVHRRFFIFITPNFQKCKKIHRSLEKPKNSIIDFYGKAQQVFWIKFETFCVSTGMQTKTFIFTKVFLLIPVVYL